MHRCAVIGSPIAHSLSPLLHRTAYTGLGIADQFSYDAFEVTPDTLGDFIASLGPEWVGLSVTAPNKQALLAYGSPDPIAAALQSGNTIIFGRDKLPGSIAPGQAGRPTAVGKHDQQDYPAAPINRATGRITARASRVYNTDVTGMLAALGRIGVRSASTAVVIGNGATARSAFWALGKLGVREAIVLARNPERAHASLDEVAQLAGISFEVQPYGQPARLPEAWVEAPTDQPGGSVSAADSAAPKADLLISTVPVESDDELAAALVAQSRTVFEVVYNNYPSAFDRAAQAAKVPSLDGLDLLVGQAIDQIKLMTGRDADPEPLLEVCRAEVLRRS
ncbi:hypothetical protein [Propionimicrobium sp. PCR01-08-3]|uniref:shikimate dehydrogenase family protein n=1 Tax=Propionimicrobium sp. PCR01-08-3 TaxID=3052086 RepID=UPI00255D0F76|nr:hypothetical protein [Propionimicrobium sp. PCR01-08-3]WIY82736.1 hypothetical protein QQ658_14765 [Propionimicrobium sp. PCR01-08-3]